MVRFYDQSEYESLINKHKKLTRFLIFFTIIFLLLFVFMFLFVTRENKIMMKIILSLFLIICLYIDSYLFFYCLKECKIEINHFEEVNKYEEVILSDCKVISSNESFTKNGVLLTVVELEIESKKKMYYLKDKNYNISSFNTLITKGHFIVGGKKNENNE